MDAVTYPEDAVIDFINTNMIPLRVRFDAQPHAKDFGVKWTPTVITLDPAGEEHPRTVGFLDAGELVASLKLGIGKAQFMNDRFEEALSTLGELIASHPESQSAPEAIFHHGVAGYKSSQDPKKLREAYEKLKAEYPDSEWAKRAYPYRLIE
jgi:tetratricopeptide (TPR) repeat protein